MSSRITSRPGTTGRLFGRDIYAMRYVYVMLLWS